MPLNGYRNDLHKGLALQAEGCYNSLAFMKFRKKLLLLTAPAGGSFVGRRFALKL